MRSTLTDDDAHDGVSTSGALLFLSPIDAWFIHSAINHTVAEVASKLLNRLDKGFTNGLMELRHVLLSQ